MSLINGRIYDPAGAGIASATVCVQSLDRTAWSAARTPTCTTSSESGAYQLAIDGPSWLQITASAADFEPGKHGAPIRGGDAHSGVDVHLLPGGARLAGEVVDALGGPVGGARVWVEHELDGGMAAIDKADESGRFSLSVPEKTRLRVMAIAEGYAPAQTVWVAPADGVRLVLSPASSLSGRVVLAEGGAPVAGLTVRAHLAGQLTDLEDLLGVSAEDGSFIIAGAYAGRHELTARSEHFRSRPMRGVDVGLAQHVRGLIIEVDRAVVVRGDAVIAGTGRPCQPGAAMLFDATQTPSVLPMRFPREGTFLSLDGTFELRGVLPGRYRAEVDCANHVSMQKGFDIVVDDEDVEGLHFSFEAGKHVRIEAKNSAGEPLAGAWVQLMRVPQDPSRKPGWAGLTNGEGWCDIGGLDAGAFEASAPKLPSVPRQRVELAESDDAKTVTLTSAGDAFIVVQVHGEPGALDNRIEAHAVPLPEQGAQQPAARYPLSGEPLGDGRFEIGPLAAGSYEVFVSDPDNPSQQVEGSEGAGIRVAAGQRLTLDVQLRPLTGSIAGRVVDRAGAPVRDAWVSARFAGQRPVPLLPDVRHLQGETRILTDVDGRFEIGRLDREAVFTVGVERPDDGAVAVREGVRPGEDVSISLDGPGELQGSVVDDQGKPVDHFRIRTRSAPTGVGRELVVHDASGRFSLSSVVPGEVEITALTRKGERGSLNVSLAPNEALRNLRIVARSR